MCSKYFFSKQLKKIMSEGIHNQEERKDNEKSVRWQQRKCSDSYTADRKENDTTLEKFLCFI